MTGLTLKFMYLYELLKLRFSPHFNIRESLPWFRGFRSITLYLMMANRASFGDAFILLDNGSQLIKLLLLHVKYGLSPFFIIINRLLSEILYNRSGLQLFPDGTCLLGALLDSLPSILNGLFD
jgi:hypothetical protein